MKKGLTITVFLCVMGITWTTWKAVGAEDRYLNLQIFAKVLNIIQQYYVEPVDTQKLIYGGIKGMLRELDPHTNFLPPDIYKEFETETTGEFGGIGIEISVEDNILTIISPIEDTPAWKAGILPGDKVVEIDGVSTKGMSLVDAASKMKGKNGSKIRMGIMRDSFEEPKTFTITRDVVKIKSVKFTDLGQGYGYIRLTSFIENSAKEMRKKVEWFKAKNKGSIKGLILDLRRNPGGLLDQATQISNLFLDKGIIVSTIGRDKAKKEVTMAKPEGANMGFPIVVLINEYSASASEIVAGALKDNKRALIMGKRSFGKGSVQSVVKMGDGSGLKLTVARYYTPSGISIQGEGITPDVEVDEVDSETLEKATAGKQVRRESDIQGHLVGDAEKARMAKKESKGSEWWKKYDAKGTTEQSQLLSKDYQVSQAYNYLKAYKVLKNL
jgi:carboxyl-terminal processing protease